MTAPTYFYAYPLSPGGGVFLTLTAAGILLGAAFQERRNLLLALFGGLGVAAACAGVGYPRLPHGPVTRWQVGSIILAIAVEMALLPFLRRWLRPRGERMLMLGILTLVGAHFLLMYPAFGPLFVALGLLAMAIAGLGFYRPALPFRLLWMADGVLKMVFGLVLWRGTTAFPAF